MDIMRDNNIIMTVRVEEWVIVINTSHPRYYMNNMPILYRTQNYVLWYIRNIPQMPDKVEKMQNKIAPNQPKYTAKLGF